MKYLLLFILLTSSAFAYDPFTTPYYQQVAEGKITGASIVTKFGFNTDIGASYEDIWSAGGDVHYISTAGTCSVVSDEIIDNATGLGAWKINMQGLDASGDMQEEEILLTGTTPVITSGSWSVVFRAYVTEMGSANTDGLSNGTITFTVDGGVCAEIPEDYAQTEMSLYTVPTGKKGYILTFQISSPRADDAEIELLARGSRTSPWAVKLRVTTHEGLHQTTPVVPMGPFPAGTDVRWRAKRVGSGDVDVSVQFQMLLIDD